MKAAGRWVFAVLVSSAVVLVGLGCEAAPALAGIEVSQGKSSTGSNEIRATVPGRFKVVLCDGSAVKGSPSDTGVSGFYDLQNDPQEKYNYAANWSGFFSHKLSIDPRREGKTGAIMPGPGTVELLEANPLRVVMRYSWGARAYGGGAAPLNPDVRLEQTFTVSAPDRLYQTFAIVGTGDEVKLTHFSFVLHTSHARFAGGKTGKGGVYSLPAPWTFVQDETRGPKTCVLHVAQPGVVNHGDGTQSHHKMNFLMIMHKATAHYGYRGNLWLGYRTALSLHADDPVITKDKRLEWHSLVIANHDVTDLEKAAATISEYREPGTPTCAKGAAVGDGFDEATGCYQMKAAAGGVDFELPAACHWPMFEIQAWPGKAPRTILVGGARKSAGADYLAHAAQGKLLVQIAADVPRGTRIVIGE